MVAELRRSVAHDAAAEKYRTPLGALPAGSRLHLFLAVCSESVGDVRLILFDDACSQELVMSPQDGGFCVDLTVPERPQVLWYYFKLQVAQDIYYYGAAEGGVASLGAISHSRPSAFQITVYAPDFHVPAWFSKSVMYQIFPDRFAAGEKTAVATGLAYHQSLGRGLYLHESWDDPVDYLPLPGASDYDPCDCYGGTLDAIRRQLPALQALGVGVIYLNPVFEANSNHRYNTADYLRIDPLLGSEADLRALCTEARALGIRVLLDGVFSHTGADSVYFNRDQRYAGCGAYQSRNSPYASWYDFHSFPDVYRCWWGFESLPEVNEQDASWQDFIIRGEESVIRHWLRAGAAGFRLDVADELPDAVLELIRRVVKEEDEANIVLGEVWEDPTTKRSYGVRRRYALGTALDSVMNYPLRDAIVGFLLQHGNAHQLAAFLRVQRLNYPPPLYYALMNLLSSHDIARIRSVLASRLDARTLSREQQASFVISEAQDARGAALQKLAVAIQFSLPGVPCIYYGDEQGMQGFLDPFNRAPFHPGKHPLVDWYTWWSTLRQQEDALTTGAVAMFAPHADVLCILRHVTAHDVFGAAAKPGCLLVAVNRAAEPREMIVDLYRPNCGFDAAQLAALHACGLRQARSLLTGAEEGIEAGLLRLRIAACSADCWRLF